MKELITLTDEDALKVINTIHLLTKNTLIKRGGSVGLSFEESFRRYGSAYIEFELLSEDKFDGHWTTTSKCRIRFHHTSVWFQEFSSYNEPSTYNKNHYFGYLKLIELGYKLPDKPQWT